MIEYNTLFDKVNVYIDNLQYKTQPEGLYAPIKYVLSLGGKRIRPILMLMAYNLYKKWDNNTAILSGDAMLISAYRLFIENYTSTANFIKALKTFNEATLGVCDGQQYDVEFENRNDVNEKEYMEMIRLKTSLLLACALKIGAELACASEEDANNLYLFGEKIGLAFQLQDDLLDVYGDPNIFGKKIGGDILCNKKTFMLINAINMANNNDKEELKQWIEKQHFNPKDKIEAVTNIYNKVGIKDLCLKKIEELFSESLDNLYKVNVEESKKLPLKDFANRLLKRNN